MDDIRFNGRLNILIEELGFTQVERSENYTFAYKTGKPLFSFIFAQNGSLEYAFTTLEKSVTINKRDCIFIPKNLPYAAVYLQNHTNIKILTFDVNNLAAARLPNKPLKLKNSELDLIFSSISAQNMYSPLFLSAKIYELIYHFTSEDDFIPQKYKKLLPAIAELKRQYFKNEKISYYSDLCFMSETNFRKLFKEYTGHSPITYRNLIRISAVKSLINTGETSISEAAYLVGFNNMSFFYQVYNKYKNG